MTTLVADLINGKMGADSRTSWDKTVRKWKWRWHGIPFPHFRNVNVLDSYEDNKTKVFKVDNMIYGGAGNCTLINYLEGGLVVQDLRRQYLITDVEDLHNEDASMFVMKKTLGKIYLLHYSCVAKKHWLSYFKLGGADTYKVTINLDVLCDDNYNFMTIGSGGDFAAGAFEVTRDIHKAVKAGIECDEYSGGEILVLSLNNDSEDDANENFMIGDLMYEEL